MPQLNIEKFFAGKFFRIPAYQRDYAWQLSNVDDLFEDIQEAIESQTSHFLGTFVLSNKAPDPVHHVVDGQQRLTTLTMLLHALIGQLPTEEQTLRIVNEDRYIRSENQWRLMLLGTNDAFFRKLLAGEEAAPDTMSQKRLAAAYQHIRQRVRALRDQDARLLPAWLKCIQGLEVMEFVEGDDGRAIRIFQTVNDRGVTLTNMEKAKSLLIYYSNRYLGGNLDGFINDCFGQIFRDYDKAKETGTKRHVQLVSTKTFTEDDVMRYHFLSYPNDKYDYDAGADYVLNEFLKATLKKHRGQPGALATFLRSYVTDLAAFFASFTALIEKTSTDERYYKALTWLGLSALLFPLAIRLQQRGLLDRPVPNKPERTFLDLLITAEIRVYKFARKGPKKDISYLARDAAGLTPEQVSARLGEFVRRFMPDSSFLDELKGYMYENDALMYALLEHGDTLLRASGKPARTLADILQLDAADPSTEHVFPQEPTFDFPNRGFASAEDYAKRIQQLGNLTLLEGGINTRCRNKTPEQKVSEDRLYKASAFGATKALAAAAQNRGNTFTAADVAARTEELAGYCVQRWPLWT